MTPGELPAPRFEQAVQELDRILRDLEDGTTTLEESLARYERGVALLRICYGQLQTAEQKIRLLSGLQEDGQPELSTFEHTASIEKEKGRAPTRRPSSNGRPTEDPPF